MRSSALSRKSMAQTMRNAGCRCRCTRAGRAVLPDMDRENFRFDAELVRAMKTAGAWEMFCSFPLLYRRIKRIIRRFARRDPKAYQKKLDRLLVQTLQDKMHGEWDDYGRMKEENEKRRGAKAPRLFD